MGRLVPSCRPCDGCEPDYAFSRFEQHYDKPVDRRWGGRFRSAQTNWIKVRDDGRYSSMRFDNLALSAGATWSGASEDRRKAILGPLQGIGSNARYLHDDWANLLTIISRVDWMHGLMRADSSFENAWIAFAAIDVSHFHVELRSAFDHLAKIVAACSKRPGETPRKSYHDLSTWVSKNRVRAARLVGEGLTTTVEQAHRFFPDPKEHQRVYRAFGCVQLRLSFQGGSSIPDLPARNAAAAAQRDRGLHVQRERGRFSAVCVSYSLDFSGYR